jgi:hypothetical protein
MIFEGGDPLILACRNVCAVSFPEYDHLPSAIEPKVMCVSEIDYRHVNESI